MGARLPRRSRLVAGFLVWLFYGAPFCAASTITLLSQVDCSVSTETARCRVEVENSGDEAAKELMIELAVAGQDGSSHPVGDLGPGERWTAELEPPQPTGLGRYPAIMRIRYLDEHGYPFSVLAHSYMDRGAGVAARLDTATESVALAGEGNLRWRVTSLESQPVSVSATLLLPEELESSVGGGLLRIGPGETVQGSYAISLSSALAPSRYRIYLLVEYDLDGTHRSLFVPAEVEVVAARHAAVVGRPPVLIGLLVVAAVGCALQLRAHKWACAPPAVVPHE